jgi:hypothetical protein
MSSIASVASQPPVAPPVQRDADQDQAKAAAKKADEVAATAVKAQNAKAEGTGTVVDIQA